MGKSYSVVNIIRRVVQLVSFILIPGLFASSFAAVGTLVKAIPAGSGSGVARALILLAATVPATILLGRFFCGFFCSFGAMQDLMWSISGKTFGHRIKVSENADRVLKYFKYVFLIFIIVFVWLLGVVTIDSGWDPWAVFGMYFTVTKFTSITDFSGLISIGGALLLVIIIGSLFFERFFCRYICPMGAIYAIVSKVRPFKIKKNREGCGACRICTNNCTMGIPLYQTDKVSSGECIDCFKFADACPRANVKADPKPAAAAAISVIAISGLYFAGNTASTVLADQGSGVSSSQSSSSSETKKGKYTDGTHTGSGTGYRGTTEVSVKVSNGYIKSIDIVSYSDDQEYFDEAKNTVISEIINKQSTDVSAVSGATYSSNGIMEAVADALGVSSSSSSSSSSSGQDNESAAPGAQHQHGHDYEDDDEYDDD